MKKEKTVRFSISLLEALVADFNKIISSKGGNRSKAIADLINEKIVEDRWQKPDKKTVAVVMMVYNHQKRELGEKLAHLQHHHHREIISNLHVHLDKQNCLEIIVVKGRGRELKELAEHLFAEKGVKFGKLFPAAAGNN